MISSALVCLAFLLIWIRLGRILRAVNLNASTEAGAGVLARHLRDSRTQLDAAIDAAEKEKQDA